ncbi:DUF5009 domain-containing protein [Poriferisphaera sp. WC338]|uniref:DUF5009 domain-containing protein n=1 Tax=Poriferisphaera sp. WC338 TaxID=3425129 RepID=UPI003D815C4D
MSTAPLAVSNQLRSPDTGRFSDRILSLDAVRGFTILAMIFVNDVSAVTNVPDWMKHFKPVLGDGMTFVDVVFPAFLFIVGMSIPMAFSKRLESQSIPKLLGHIFIRAFALILLGMLRVRHPSNDEIGWYPGTWLIAMYCAVFMVWHHVRYKSTRAKHLGLAIRLIGAVMLIYLMVIFRRDGAYIQPYWGGILALIGYAYLISALFYLMVRNNRLMLLAGVVILYCVYILFRTRGVPWDITPYWNGARLFWFDYKITGETIGSQAAITLTGVLLGTLFTKDSDIRTPWKRVKFTLILAAMLTFAGYLLDPLYGINKPTATLTWCLYCSAITATLWAAMYILIDIYHIKKWSVIFSPAGSNPLFAYLLAPFIGSFIIIIDTFTEQHWQTLISLTALNSMDPMPYIGIAKSIIFAFFIVGITGLSARIGFRLKL